MRGFRRSWLVLLWAPAWCICWPCVLWAATPETYGPSSAGSGPDWQELQSSLDEIASGLSMIELPLSEIEQRLIERENALREREQASSETSSRLLLREQALNEREQGLNERESLYADMGADLGKAKGKLRHRWIWILGAAAVGFLAGMAAHR